MKTNRPSVGGDQRSLYSEAQLRRTLDYMRAELRHSRKLFTLRGKPRVYYLSYLFRNQFSEQIWGRLGAINENSRRAGNSVFCDVRVGGPRKDNVVEGGLHDNSERDESNDYADMPLELDRDALRFSLWKLTDARYREAAEKFYERKSQEMHFQDIYPGLPSRSELPRVNRLQYRKFSSPDIDYWRHLIRKAGLLVKKYREIQNSWFEFGWQARQHLFASSSGSTILQQSAIYELRGHVWHLTKNGEGIAQEINFIEGDVSDLPGEKEFLRLVREKIDYTLRLRRAPRLNSYAGPVLLSPGPSGVFFHEVAGHRLEGCRLLSADEGATFLDLQGKRIAPDFIDIVDDPTMAAFRGRRMIGSFDFDDEGAPAQRVTMVEGGVLKRFLTSAAPIPGQKNLNGHARNQRNERPISRMGNLFVLPRRPTPRRELFEMFLEEIRRQKRPFGIWVQEVIGGETVTENYDFQAFKGDIVRAARVFPDGRSEPVRGVDFVGTPLSALDSIVALGDDLVMDNSYCGAESGMIPVATVAPSALIRNLELQAKDRERLTQYPLQLPY